MKKIAWTNEKRKLSELTPWPRNPRTINKEEAGRLSKSLKEFNQIETIAIGPKNEVYNGHQRLNVWADDYGPDFEVDVRVSSRKLTEKEREKLTIYLHKGATGEWDWDLLANEFEVDELLDWGFSQRDLEIEGFEFGGNGDAPEAQIDKAEELQKKWQVERGQIWEIGRHRLMCGDATQAEYNLDWVLFTDPPYGIDYAPMSLDDVGSHRQTSRANNITGDDGEIDLSFLFDFDRRLIWGFPYIYDPDATGWLVWDKQPGRDGRDIVTPIEIASTTLRKGFDLVRVLWIGYYRASGEDRQPHPTQKPIGVLEPFIKRWSKENDCIYDPFVGSGSTMVACERLKRICEAVEIEPKYCAVTLERMSEMGLKPKLMK